MEILYILVISILNIVCFFIGAKIGQKVVKGEDIKLPEVNPMKIYKEHKEHKAAEKEKNKLDIILKNIDRYDGTASGQEDVPQ
jgi:hypothetical protein